MDARAPFVEPAPVALPVGPEVPAVAAVAAPVAVAPALVDMDPPTEQPVRGRPVSPEVKFRQNLWSFYLGPELVDLHYDGHSIDVPEFEYSLRISQGDRVDIVPGSDSVAFKHRGASLVVSGKQDDVYNVVLDTGVVKTLVSFTTHEDNDLANLIDIILNHYGVGEEEQQPAMPEEPVAPVAVPEPVVPMPVVVQDPIVAPGGRRKTYRKKGRKATRKNRK